MKITLSLLITCIILTSLAINLWGIAHDMPYCYEHDEINFVTTALSFGKGNLNPVSFNHGSFLYYFLFLEYLVFYFIKLLAGSVKSGTDFLLYYINNPSIFFILGRVSAALLASFSVFLAYLIGKKLVNSCCGILAAIFLAFSLLFVNMAHLIKEDIFYVFFLLLSFLCIINADRSKKLFYLAAFLIGVAVSCKYLAILGIIFVFTGFFTVQKRSFRSAAKEGILACVFMSAGFFLCQPFAFVHMVPFFRNILELKGHIYDRPIGDHKSMIWYIYLIYLKKSMGLPLFIASIASVLLVLRKDCLRINILVLPFVFIYFVFISSGVNVQPNYLMAILPFIGIYTAVFIAKYIHAPAGKPQNLLVSFIIGFLLVSPSFINVLRYDYLLTMPDTRAVSKEWIESNIPQNSRILIEGAFPWEIVHNPPLLENKECLKEELNEICDKGGKGILWEMRISQPDKKKSTKYFLKKEGFFNKYTTGTLSKYMPDYVVVSSYYDHGFWVSKNDRKIFYEDLLKKYSLVKNFTAYPYIIWFPSFNTLRENPENLRYVNLLSRNRELIAGPNVSIYQRKLPN